MWYDCAICVQVLVTSNFDYVEKQAIHQKWLCERRTEATKVAYF